MFEQNKQWIKSANQKNKTVNKNATNRHIELLQNAENLLYNSPKIMYD